MIPRMYTVVYCSVLSQVEPDAVSLRWPCRDCAVDSTRGLGRGVLEQGLSNLSVQMPQGLVKNPDYWAPPLPRSG